MGAEADMLREIVAEASHLTEARLISRHEYRVEERAPVSATPAIP